MLNESVIKLLKNGMWDLATCANEEPNVVPVAFDWQKCSCGSRSCGHERCA